MEQKSAEASISKSRVVTAPLPSEEPVVTDYRVFVNGQEVSLYTSLDEKWEKEYYFGSFDFEGLVDVKIESSKSLEKAIILPAVKYGIQPTLVSATTMTFQIDRPFRIAIERDGRVKPLLLFGNELEQDVPNPSDPTVIYFGPGTHHPGLIHVTSGQTLYLAAGAVVHGGIEAVGDNITIRGRGLLAGESFKRFQGPCENMLSLRDCHHGTISGIMFRNAWSWTLTTWQCDDVTIDNVKICCSNMINDDAIDLCNTRHAHVSNCFLRTQDDTFAIKGMDSKRPTACEDILIEGCECWADKANIFRVGYESECEAIHNIRAENLDILHYSEYCGPERYWSHAIIWLQPSNGKSMYDCHFSHFRVYCNGEDMCMLIAKTMCCKILMTPYVVSGNLHDCTLSDMTVYGTKGVFRGELHFEGRSEREFVKDITVRNLDYFGQKVTKDSSCVTIRDFVSGIDIR